MQFDLVHLLKYIIIILRKIFNRILFFLSFGIIVLTTLLTFALWPFPILNGRNVKNLRTWAQIFKQCTILLGVKWELRNGKILAKDQGAVIVSNHQSVLDIVGLSNIWETVGNATVVAKKEFLYIWPLSIMPYFGGVAFIDRGNAKQAYKMLEVTSRGINEEMKLWFFPEGTRNCDYTKLLPFKKGAFITAVSRQAPIIPVVFSPYYFIDRKNYTFSKGRVIIQCLEEVPTTGLTVDGVPELIERVRNTMLVTYKELSKEVMTTKPYIGEIRVKSHVKQ